MLVVGALLSSGCGAASVRALTKGENDYIGAVSKRIDENHAALDQLMSDLRSLDRQYAFTEQQKTTTAVAEAKLLEAMKSPWTAPSPSLQATQRAVALFHLYDLLGQEQARFEAGQAERDAQRQGVVDAYSKISKLMAEVLTNEKVVLEYVNQPPGSQIAGILDETLTEAHAFNDEVSRSQDPRLQALASETQKATDRVDQAKAAIEAVLNALNTAKK